MRLETFWWQESQRKNKSCSYYWRKVEFKLLWHRDTASPEAPLQYRDARVRVEAAESLRERDDSSCNRPSGVVGR